MFKRYDNPVADARCALRIAIQAFDITKNGYDEVEIDDEMIDTDDIQEYLESVVNREIFK